MSLIFTTNSELQTISTMKLNSIAKLKLKIENISLTIL